MEETFKRYELLCKDVKYQIDFINDYYEFDFKHLEETLNEMKSLQKRILLAKETLIIRIGGCLHENGRISLIPYPKDRRLKIRKQGERFYTITDLKKYYGIKKTTKTGEKEWAISPRGKRYEWDVLEAEISMEYVAL